MKRVFWLVADSAARCLVGGGLAALFFAYVDVTKGMTPLNFVALSIALIGNLVVIGWFLCEIEELRGSKRAGSGGEDLAPAPARVVNKA